MRLVQGLDGQGWHAGIEINVPIKAEAVGSGLLPLAFVSTSEVFTSVDFDFAFDAFDLAMVKMLI